jgi:mannosyltransferase OCH1-like enzyme
MMIPKVIHYCWFGQNPLPENLVKCIESWQNVLKDYEIVVWDEKRFDVKEPLFVKEAYQLKKWAFVADYIRLHALFTEGGIYLDTDVRVIKKFDEFLDTEFFSSIECHPSIMEEQNAAQYLNSDGASKQPYTPIPGIGMQSAFLGSRKGHPFLKECLDYYKKQHFLLSDGTYFDKIIAPTILSMNAERYGFKYIDKDQFNNNGMRIYNSEVFASRPDFVNEKSYAVHYCVGSWKDQRKESIIRRIVNKLKRMYKG